jgi:hypothetical protein
MRWRCWLSIPVLSFALAQPVSAAPSVPDFSNGPVVFDFEDGLQGGVRLEPSSCGSAEHDVAG